MTPSNQESLQNRGRFQAKHAAITKSGPEIKNRCSSKPVLEAGHSSSQQRRIESDAEVLCLYDRSRRNHSLLSQRKLVSDADVVVATPAAGGAILCCRKENKNRMRNSLLPRPLQAGHSSLLLGKLETDTELVAATPAAGGPFFFAATKNRIGHGPRSRYDNCRRNHSLLPHGKLE